MAEPERQEPERRERPRTWAQAALEVRDSLRRHKLATAAGALLVAGSLAAIGWAAAPAGSGTAAASTTRASGDRAVTENQPAAGFRLDKLGSSSGVSLASYQGKPLVLNFFASWCAPCKQETPMLARWYRSEHGHLALIGLDENDNAASAASFIRRNGVGYPVLSDPGLAAASAYDVTGLPQTFFLNSRHRIVYRVFGALTQADIRRGTALATGS